MAKNNQTVRKSEKVQIAKIGAVQAIVVGLIAAVATAIPAYFTGKQQGKNSAVIEPAPNSGGQPDVHTIPQGKKEGDPFGAC